MTNEQFIFWLKGVIDSLQDKEPSLEQWDSIITNLNSVKESPYKNYPSMPYIINQFDY